MTFSYGCGSQSRWNFSGDILASEGESSDVIMIRSTAAKDAVHSKELFWVPHNFWGLSRYISEPPIHNYLCLQPTFIFPPNSNTHRIS